MRFDEELARWSLNPNLCPDASDLLREGELSIPGADVFDGAVGEYEKVLRYLSPLFGKLTVPMVIVGLEAPETFRVEKKKNSLTGKNKGSIVKI